MSTYWNVACLSCGVAAEWPHINHGEDACALLAQHAGAIAGLQPLMQALAGPSGPANDLQLSIYGGERGTVDIAWVFAHRAHIIVGLNEYGGVAGDCNDWEGDQLCRLPAGHAGEHALSPRLEFWSDPAALLGRRQANV